MFSTIIYDIFNHNSTISRLGETGDVIAGSPTFPCPEALKSVREGGGRPFQLSLIEKNPCPGQRAKRAIDRVLVLIVPSELAATSQAAKPGWLPRELSG